MREIVARLDLAILLQGRDSEIDALALPAALLRQPNGGRIAFVGDRRCGKTWLALLLLEAGWGFEGDGWVLARSDGIVALPRTMRVSDAPPTLSPAVLALLETAPTLDAHSNEQVRAVDPRSLTGSWTIEVGPLHGLMFLELNPGGLDNIRTMKSDEAFGRALLLCQGRMSAISAALLRSAVTLPRAFRLRLGSAERAVATVTQALSA